jgi:TATA-box binding protein (TBP) (component of TFIID and TFIIIB)
MADTRNPPRPPGVDNVVCKFRLGNPIEPDYMTLVLNGQYAPQIFPAAVCHVLNPNTTLVAFKTGTTIVLGAKHPSDALVQIYIVIFEIFRELGVICSVLDFRVENVVGSAHTGCKIDIAAIARQYSLRTVLEPTTFPGLHFQLGNQRIKYILFPLGRMVITGARTGLEIHTAYNDIVPVLRKFILAP